MPNLPPPDDRALRCATDDGKAAFDAAGRFDLNCFDAIRTNRSIVVKRYGIECAMQAAEISEIWATPGEGVQSPLGRC